MVRAGAAVMLEEPDLRPARQAADALTGLLVRPERLAAMAAAARTPGASRAAERIADRLAALAR